MTRKKRLPSLTSAVRGVGELALARRHPAAPRPGTMEGYREWRLLALAVLTQAGIDVGSEHGEDVSAFLATPLCAAVCELAEVNLEALTRAIMIKQQARGRRIRTRADGSIVVESGQGATPEARPESRGC